MKTFIDYIKETREYFVKIAGLYSLQKHSKLRTEIDNLLIAYDQLLLKYKEANEFILEIAKVVGINTDPIGFDDIKLTIGDFEDIIPRFITIKEEMPKTQQRVYILCESEYNNKVKRFQTIAEYIPYMTVKEENYIHDDYAYDGDYNECNDEFYVKEGFYEWQSEANINFRITAKVIAWMPLFDIDIDV